MSFPASPWRAKARGREPRPIHRQEFKHRFVRTLSLRTPSHRACARCWLGMTYRICTMAKAWITTTLLFLFLALPAHAYPSMRIASVSWSARRRARLWRVHHCHRAIELPHRRPVHRPSRQPAAGPRLRLVRPVAAAATSATACATTRWPAAAMCCRATMPCVSSTSCATRFPRPPTASIPSWGATICIPQGWMPVPSAPAR